MANRYWVGGSGTWSASSTANWSTTSGGASGASVPTATDVAIFDQAATYTVTISGTGSRTALAITNTAGTVTFAGTTALAIGGLTLTATAVWTHTGGINFTVAGTHTLDTKNVIVGVSTFSASGTSWTLASDFRATGTARFSGGTLDLNGHTLTSDQFDAVTSIWARTLAFGTGQITVTGLVTTTIIDFYNSSYPSLITMTGSKRINISSARTGGALADLGPYEVDLYVTQGAYALGMSGNSVIRNADFTGFTGVVDGSISLTGNLVFGAGMTGAGSSLSLTTTGTGAQNITSNGLVTIIYLRLTGPGTVQLQDALTLESGASVEIVSGVLDLNGFVMEVNLAYLIGYDDLGDPTTPELQMSSGTIRVENGLLFDVPEPPAALPAVTGSGTIEIFGDTVFYNVSIGWGIIDIADTRVAAFPTVRHTGTASLQVYGNNTFTSFESASTAGALGFFQGETNTFGAFDVSGAPGNLKTLTAVPGYLVGTQATLLKSTPWFVGANSVDEGNNTGLIFSGTGAINYLAISNIAVTTEPVYGWVLIDDSQTSNWQNASNAQTPNWQNIIDVQSPGWTPTNQ